MKYHTTQDSISCNATAAHRARLFIALICSLFIIRIMYCSGNADHSGCRSLKKKIEFFMATGPWMPQGKSEANKVVRFVPFGDRNRSEIELSINRAASMTEKDIQEICIEKDKLIKKQYFVILRFSSSGAKKCADITSKNIGKHMLISVDGRPILFFAIGGAASEEAHLGPWSKSEAEELVSILCR